MKRLLLIISLLLFSVLGVRAQEKIIVMGEITSKADDSALQYVRVYAYNTVAEGRDAYNEAKSYFDNNMEWVSAKDHIALSDPSGYYEVPSVPANGSLLFYLNPFEPVFIQVKGKKKINIKIEATQMLDEAELVAEGGKELREEETVAFGKNIDIKKIYDFDKERMGEIEKLGKTNARLVAQMFIVNADFSDTLMYYPPMIYDGEQFHRTQLHWSPDTLYRSAGNLEEVKDTLLFTGVFENNDEKNIYFAKAHIWIEDFIKTYYSDTIDVMNTGRLKRPFEFLEYSFDECHLDRQKYKKEPRREQVDDAKNLSLKFQVNSAELDMSDAQTAADITGLKKILKEICDEPTSTLKELHVNGYSSPDGTYAKNLELSKRRTQTVKSELHSVLTRGAIERLYQTGDGHVAEWSELANILERDSLISEAEDVRRIIEKYPNIDQQGVQLKNQLPYYKSKISPRLDSLRTVKCVYSFEMLRYLEPHEILAKFNEDEEYRSGIKPMTLNEYWHLFDLVKDEKQLEDLYKRALAASIKAEKKPWPLPANLLAVSYLRQERVDTMLLKPFLDETFGANFEIKSMYDKTKVEEVINDESIVANQVQMYMLAKDYASAAKWSSLIEGKYPMLRAVARCLGGKLNYYDPAEEESINLIKSSSPRNEVIVNMFMQVFDSTTVAALQRMPVEDPLTDYLKAQRLCRQYKTIAKMNGTMFDRNEDPLFKHPDDKEIPVGSPEEIEALKQSIAGKREEAQSYEGMGMDDIIEDIKKEIAKDEEQLAKMESGEVVIEQCECTVYSAAYNYLKQCFAKDKEFESKAKADAYICEELLNDVLGIETKKK